MSMIQVGRSLTLEGLIPRKEGELYRITQEELEELVSACNTQGLSLWLRNCLFYNVDLSGMDLRRSQIESSLFVRCLLRQTRCEEAYFYNCGIGQSDLRGIDLSGACVKKTPIADSSLRFAILRDAFFIESEWERLDVSDAILVGRSLKETMPHLYRGDFGQDIKVEGAIFDGNGIASEGAKRLTGAGACFYVNDMMRAYVELNQERGFPIDFAGEKALGAEIEKRKAACAAEIQQEPDIRSRLGTLQTSDVARNCFPVAGGNVIVAVQPKFPGRVSGR